MPSVVVYLPAAQARELEAAGEDPALWVRSLVKWGFPKWRARQESHEPLQEQVVNPEPLREEVASEPPSVIRTAADAARALESLPPR